MFQLLNGVKSDTFLQSWKVHDMSVTLDTFHPDNGDRSVRDRHSENVRYRLFNRSVFHVPNGSIDDSE